jgi:DNA invertase Pin-like site-specific DNA recombinase
MNWTAATLAATGLIVAACSVIDYEPHELVEQYIDDGYTGMVLDRPALNRMRADLKTDRFDRIYFLAADRIAREVEYQRIIVGELLKHGKQITINGKDYVQNPENKLTLTMLGAFAEFEQAKIIERTTRGRLHRLRMGDEQQRASHIWLPLRKEDFDSPGNTGHQRGTSGGRPVNV